MPDEIEFITLGEDKWDTEEPWPDEEPERRKAESSPEARSRATVLSKAENSATGFQKSERPGQRSPSRLKSRGAKKGKKRRGRKFVLLQIFFVLFFLAGLGLVLYPVISDAWNRYRSSKLISGYTQSVRNLTGEQYDQILDAARKYNSQHTVNVVADAFDGSDSGEDQTYELLLNPNGDGIMGSIEIPKIHVDLAIYHGTGDEALSSGAGHLRGTSLPVGGENTHAVISGHRGLPSAKLFTDLDQLENGDVFYIHVLNENLEYQVDQIKTVLPTDLDDLEIIPGGDYVTLVTCTPYGVNTHRLLIRGTRIPYDRVKDVDLAGTGAVEAGSNLLQNRLFIMAAALVTFAVVLLLIVVVRAIRQAESRAGLGEDSSDEDSGRRKD